MNRWKIGKNGRDLLFLTALLHGFVLAPVGHAAAQPFSVLHPFAATNSEGIVPEGLTSSGDTLFGTTLSAPILAGWLTVFAVPTNGAGFTTLRTLPVSRYDAHLGAEVIVSGNILYGTTVGGGSAEAGSVFKLNTDGTGLTNLYEFTPGTNNDGAYPKSGLMLSCNTLYGTTSEGGVMGVGTIFKLNTDGKGFVPLHSFRGLDGAYPVGSLVISGNTLFGMTSRGGSAGEGSVFKLGTDGTGFATLHNFGPLTPAYYLQINPDGAVPSGTLIVSGDTLYGTTTKGGDAGGGTVFKVNTDGTGFMVLRNFVGNPLNRLYFTNSDGTSPCALVQSGGTLYGATSAGGSGGGGSLFELSTDGDYFKTLHGFTGSDGSGPNSLISSGHTLFGTTVGGGLYSGGTVFRFGLPPPQLTITPYEGNVFIAWATNINGFSLQFTTNLGPAAIWYAVPPESIVTIGDQNVVIKAKSGG